MSTVTVWDVREPAWRRGREAKTRWLREHGLPADDMYRVEFYLPDAPFARIFCYHRSEDGKRHWTHQHDWRTCQPDHDCGPCKEPPRDVPLSELPGRLG